MGYRTDFAEKDFERNLALGLISKDLRPFERATSYLDGGRCFLQFYNGRENFERELALQRQENRHRNKVCKFKLYYSRKFRVLRSTKISIVQSFSLQHLDVSSSYCTVTVLFTVKHSFVEQEKTLR